MTKRPQTDLEQAIGRMLDLGLFLETAAEYFILEADWEMVTAEMELEYNPAFTSLSWSECQQMLKLFAKEGIRPQAGEDLKVTLREHGLLNVRIIPVRYDDQQQMALGNTGAFFVFPIGPIDCFSNSPSRVYPTPADRCDCLTNILNQKHNNTHFGIFFHAVHLTFGTKSVNCICKTFPPKQYLKEHVYGRDHNHNRHPH